MTISLTCKKLPELVCISPDVAAILPVQKETPPSACEVFITEENERDRNIKLGIEAHIIDAQGNKLTNATIDITSFNEVTTESVRQSLQSTAVTYTSSYGRLNKLTLLQLFLAALNTQGTELPIECFQNIGTDTIASLRPQLEVALVAAEPKIIITPFFRLRARDADWRIVIREPKPGEKISFWDNVESYCKSILRKVALLRGKILPEKFDIKMEAENLGIVFDVSLGNYIVLRFTQFRLDLLIGRYKNNYLSRNTALLRQIDPSTLSEDLTLLRATLYASGIDLLQILLYQNYGIMVSDFPSTHDHKAALQVLRRSLNSAVSLNEDFAIFLHTLLKKYPLETKWPNIIATKICNILKGHCDHPVPNIIWFTLLFEVNLKFASSELTENITSWFRHELWKQLPQVCFYKEEEIHKRALFLQHPVYRLIVEKKVPAAVVSATLSFAGILSLATPGRHEEELPLKITPTRHIHSRPAISFHMAQPTGESIELCLDFDLEEFLNAVNTEKDTLLTSENPCDNLVELFCTYCTAGHNTGKQHPIFNKYEKNFSCKDTEKLLNSALEWLNSTELFLQLCGVSLLAYLSIREYPKADEHLFLIGIPTLLRSKNHSARELGHGIARQYLEYADQSPQPLGLLDNEAARPFSLEQWYLSLASRLQPRLCEIACTGWLATLQIQDAHYGALLNLFEKALIAAPHSALTLLSEINRSTLSVENIRSFFNYLCGKLDTLKEDHPFLLHLEETISLANRYVESYDHLEVLPLILGLYKKVSAKRKDLLPLCYLWQAHILSEIGVDGTLNSVFHMASAIRSPKEFDKLAHYLLQSIKQPVMFQVLQAPVIKKIFSGNRINELRHSFIQTEAHSVKFRTYMVLVYLKEKNVDLSIMKTPVIEFLTHLFEPDPGKPLPVSKKPITLILRLLKAYVESYPYLGEECPQLIKSLLKQMLEAQHPQLIFLAEIICHDHCFWSLAEESESNLQLFNLLSFLLFQTHPQPLKLIQKLVINLHLKMPSDPFWHAIFKQLKLASLHLQDDSVLISLCSIENPSLHLKKLIQEISLEKISSQIYSGSSETPPLFLELIQKYRELEPEQLNQLKTVARKLLKNQKEASDNSLKWLCLKECLEAFGQNLYYELLASYEAIHHTEEIHTLLVKALEGTNVTILALRGFAARINQEWTAYSEKLNLQEKWAFLSRLYPWLGDEERVIWQENVCILEMDQDISTALKVLLHSHFDTNLPSALIPKFQTYFQNTLSKNELCYFKQLIPLASKYSKYLTFDLWTQLLERMGTTHDKKDFNTLAALWFNCFPFPTEISCDGICQDEKSLHLMILKKVYTQPSYQTLFFKQPKVVLDLLSLDEDVEDTATIYLRLLEFLLKENDSKGPLNEHVTNIRKQLLTFQISSSTLLESDIQIATLALAIEDEEKLKTALVNITRSLQSSDRKILTNTNKKNLFKFLTTLLNNPAIPYSSNNLPFMEVFHILQSYFNIEDVLWPQLLQWMLNNKDFLQSEENLKYFQKIVFYILKETSQKSSKRIYESYVVIFSSPIFISVLDSFSCCLSPQIRPNKAMASIQSALENQIMDPDVLRRGLFTLISKEFQSFSDLKEPKIEDLMDSLEHFKLISESICHLERYPAFCLENVLKTILLLYTKYGDIDLFVKTTVTFFNTIFLDPTKKDLKLYFNIILSPIENLIAFNKIPLQAHNPQLYNSLRLEFLNHLLNLPIKDAHSLEMITCISYCLLKTLILNCSDPIMQDSKSPLVALVITFFFLPFPLRSVNFKKHQSFMFEAFLEFSSVPKLFESCPEKLPCIGFFLNTSFNINEIPLPTLIGGTISELFEHSDFQFIEFIERINTPAIAANLKQLPWPELRVLLLLLQYSLGDFRKPHPAYLMGLYSLCEFLSSHSLYGSHIRDPKERLELLEMHLTILHAYIDALREGFSKTEEFTLAKLIDFYDGNEVCTSHDQQNFFDPIFCLRVAKNHFRALIYDGFFTVDNPTWMQYMGFVESLQKLYDANTEENTSQLLEEMLFEFSLFQDDPKRFGNLHMQARQMLATESLRRILVNSPNTEAACIKVAANIQKFIALLGNANTFYLHWPEKHHEYIPLIFHLVRNTTSEVLLVEYTKASIIFSNACDDAWYMKLLFHQLVHYMNLQTYCSENETVNHSNFVILLRKSIRVLLQQANLQFLYILTSIAINTNILSLSDSDIDSEITEVLELASTDSSHFVPFIQHCIARGVFSNNLLPQRKKRLIHQYLLEICSKDAKENLKELEFTFEELFEKALLQSIIKGNVSSWIYTIEKFYRGNLSLLWIRSSTAASKVEHNSLALELFLKADIEKADHEDLIFLSAVISEFLISFHLQEITPATCRLLDNLPIAKPFRSYSSTAALLLRTRSYNF
jgi:hypothetical protein